MVNSGDAHIFQPVRPTADDEGLLAKIESLVEPDEFGTAAWPKRQQRIDDVVDALSHLASLIAAEGVFGLALSHPDPSLRSALIPAVCRWLPYPLAADTLEGLVRDPDDIVCLPAIRAVGDEAVEYVITYLQTIAGWPSGTAVAPQKPVGMGAANVHRSFLKLLDVMSLDEVEQLRLFYEENGRLPNDNASALQIPEDVLRRARAECPPDMVYVAAGQTRIGLSPEQVPDRTFGWQDSAPARDAWLPPFLIDKYPVTNAEYDRFCEDVARSEHEWCHPQEPAGKRHERNTAGDSRFGPDHPATGVDWYDAVAYARWADKDLPTEYQWEVAARGPDASIWPWSGGWNPQAARWAGQVFDPAPTSLDSWREALTQVRQGSPAALTTPVTAHEQWASGYGMVDAVGNAWEWTRTERRTGRPFMLSAFMRSATPYAVTLKGGAWSSLPGLMYPSYRGHDGPTCRHNEIGFRCVKNLAYRHLRDGRRPGTRFNSLIS